MVCNSVQYRFFTNRISIVMSVIEAIFLLLILLIAMSIVVSTLRVGISPMPSSTKVRRAMLEQLNVDTNVHAIADLGSGWGHVGIAIAKAYPEVKVTGFEVSFFPWLVSIAWGKLIGLDNLTFKRMNFLAADLSSYQIYCCYLFPAGMQKLSHKLQQQKLQQQTGSQTNLLVPRQLISNTFALPDNQPVSTTTIADMYRTKVYTYYLS